MGTRLSRGRLEDVGTAELRRGPHAPSALCAALVGLGLLFGCSGTTTSGGAPEHSDGSAAGTDGGASDAPLPPGTDDASANDGATTARDGGADAAVQPDAFVDPTLARYGLTAAQKARAERITSLFEFGEAQLRYDDVEYLNDGRGLTIGRAGFTTADGDFYDVATTYAALVPNSKIAPYLPRLKTLANTGSSSVSGLGLTQYPVGGVIVGGLADTVKYLAANDAKFRDAQDAVSDRLYFAPAMLLADKAGLHTALGRAILYDTIIQHGEGTDPDGLPALLTRTRTAAGGDPINGVDELVWLGNFLTVRRADLAHAYAASTRAEWAQSVTRADALWQLVTARNVDLVGPISFPNTDYEGVNVP